MLRLTFRRNDASDDVARWDARVRDAIPSPMHVVAAYLEEGALEIYVEVDFDADVELVVREVAAALDLGACRASKVVPLAPSVSAPSTGPSALPGPRRLTNAHPARIVSVTVSADGWKLSAKVRHTRYEHVDRLESTETNDTVELVAWVGTAEDDPRADYATLAQTFSDVTIELGRPLGERRLVYDAG